VLDDANSDNGTEEEFVAQNVVTGRGETLEDALEDAAGRALRRGHPHGTRFEITQTTGAIQNPRVSDYRVILTKSGPD
jgi:hypothetical protein